MSLPVRIFDQSINLIGEVDDYESFFFERSWYKIGAFEITINRYKLYASAFQKGRFILAGNNLDSVGIITSIKYSVGEGGKGSETVTASGYQLKHLYTWRIVYPPAGQARYTETNVAETVVKNLLKAQIGSTAAAARKFTLLSINSDSGRGISYIISARYSNLAAELEDLAWATQISTTLTLDLTNKLLVSDIAQGIDRTAGQSVNGRAIFSPDYDTISGGEVVHSEVAYRSIMIVGGQGIGTSRTIQNTYSGSEPTNLARREQWIDARDLSSGTDLTARGVAKLAEYGNQDYLSVTALPYSSLVYRTHYDLGDLVTLSIAGESTDARISTARESWSHNVYNLELTFGRPFPTITARVSESQVETAATFNANE